MFTTTLPPQEWEKDARYQLLADLVPDGILIHDGEHIVLANASAVRLVGATDRAQFVGLPIDRFLSLPYLKGVERQLVDFASDGAVAPAARDTLKRLDGSELEVEVQALAFVDGHQLSVHVVMRDITQRLLAERSAREGEERLQRLQRMDTVARLAGGVAHEVNNKMQGILGLCSLLIESVRLPEDCLDDVRMIRVSATRAADVTRQLVAFSRRAVSEPRVIDLALAVRDAEQVVRQLCKEPVELVVESHDSPHVLVDPAQLEQVIVNLALNARDAMPDGGTLTMTTREIDITAGRAASDGTPIPAGRYGQLVVSDTGTGIDAGIHARIFEPFFTTRGVGQGTGLGLAAAQGIVMQNKGYLTMDSVPDEGATFSVYLPLVSDTRRVLVP